jgi:hypothetical protein
MSDGIMYIARPADARTAPVDGAKVMEYVLVLFGHFWPRLFILGFWIFGSRLGDAFSSWVIPAVGFVIAPWTTVAYAFMWGISSNTVSGWEWIVVALGVLLDGATIAGSRAVVKS